MTSRRGRPPYADLLTPAEWEVLHALRHGLSNTAIARRRATSIDAVKFHLENIREKAATADRAALRHWPGQPRGKRKEQDPMATELKLGPIGQISLTVSDLATAEPFYRDVLGLTHLYTFGNLAFFDCDGTRLFITAATDAGHSRNHSVIYFTVPDIHAAEAALRAKGVPFEGAAHLIHTHADGTEEWMAFFNDPGGNILALMSQVRHSP